MDAEVEPREAHRGGRELQRRAGTSAPNARAAANDEVVWLDGKESPVGVAIRCGRSSIAGRWRPTASLIDVEVA